MSETILQQGIPYAATTRRALPSLQVLDPAGWLIFDEAEAGQIARRKTLVAERPGDVLAALPGSEAAQAEALEMIGAHLGEAHGREVVLGQMADLAGAIQEDVVILEPRDGVHVMTAAILCFPASWSLAEKIGRPMASIHAPVAEIDTRMDRQIERVFAGLRVDRPLWRYNHLWYEDAELFQPRREDDRRTQREKRYLRSERQCLVRMPRTGAVMFTIHTYVVDGGTALFARMGKGAPPTVP
ncbi:MAG: DUF3445 domain-containing protein [Pseudomonadota bacterium]